VFLLDESKNIARANRAAARIFGPAVERKSTALSVIWSPENATAPEKVWSSPGNESQDPYKFRLRNGSSALFHTHCSAAGETRNLVLQLFQTEPPKDEFVLENSPWPAVLVDANKNIARANRAAVKVFGTVVERPETSVTAIWSPDNEASIDKMLAPG